MVKKSVQVKKTNKNKSIALSPGLIDLMNKHKDVGMEENTDGIPQLRIHSPKTRGHQLPDGNFPKCGQLFHTGLKQAFDAPLKIHVFKIMSGWLPNFDQQKRAFTESRDSNLKGEKLRDYLFSKACGLMKPDQDMGVFKNHFKTYFDYTEMLGGCLHGGNEPFLMYLSGGKVSSVWDLRNEAAPHTKRKETPIPLWSMTVNITTEVVTSDYGDNYYPVFKILRDDKGLPIIEITEEDARYFEQKFEVLENYITEYRSTNGFKSIEEAFTKLSNETVSTSGESGQPARIVTLPKKDTGEATQEEIDNTPSTEKVDSDEIPFD